MFPVAAYIRVSTEEQAEQGVSIPSQKSRLLAYIQSQGWDLYDFYIDDGYSGKDLNRPAIQQLIQDVKARKIKAVVVIKLDRLSRRQKDVLYLLEDVLELSSVGFKSVSEPFDTTTPFGKAAIGMMAVFAQLERETIIERVKDAKKESAKQGRFMGGPIPYGYDHNPAIKTVSVNTIEASIVRFIFNEYLTCGRGYQYIADCLNERQIPSPGSSDSWQRSTIKAMLHNAFYAGFIRHKEQLYKGRHPAIISEQQFFDAQKLQATRSTYNRKAESGLLVGLLYCAECGAKMRMKKVWKNPRNPKEKISYYVCYSQDGCSETMVKDTSCRSGYKRAFDLDRIIIDQLTSYNHNFQLINRLAAKFAATSNSANLTLKALNQAKKELDGIKKKLDKWYQAFENNLISAEDLNERVKELRNRRIFLESQMMAYNHAITVSNQKTKKPQEVIEILCDFEKAWANADNKERHGMLTNLIAAIRISRQNEIEIDFL